MRVMCARSTVSFTFFVCFGCGHARHLHSFPTRRSSDLSISQKTNALSRVRGVRICGTRQPTNNPHATTARTPERCRRSAGKRSEEHTSELQSRRELVCRLLLEKKNNRRHRHHQ